MAHSSSDIPLASRVEAVLGLDCRSLAAGRMAVGALLLVDLVIRSGSLAAHYTDAGVFPRVMTAFFDRPAVLSLHMLSGDAWWIGALFVLAAVAAVMLCIGYRTRVATALSWFLLLSLQLRNPAVLNLGDHLLLMLLFWGMWIPWGSTWSVDSRRRPRLKPGTQVLSVASLGLMLQIAAVYWFSYFFKTDPVWKDGEAIYYVLQLERFATGIGAWILTWPQGMLQAMGKGVLYLEVFGPMPLTLLV